MSIISDFLIELYKWQVINFLFANVDLHQA